MQGLRIAFEDLTQDIVSSLANLAAQYPVTR